MYQYNTLSVSKMPLPLEAIEVLNDPLIHLLYLILIVTHSCHITDVYVFL